MPLAFPGLTTSVEQQSDKYGSYSHVGSKVRTHDDSREAACVDCRTGLGKTHIEGRRTVHSHAGLYSPLVQGFQLL